MIPRPQPLGVLPWPAGMLVVPGGHDDVRVALLRGVPPAQWPADLEFLRLALQDSPAAAAAVIDGEDPVSRYNRAVLVGGDGAWTGFESVEADLAALAGVAAYSVGAADMPPKADGVSGEIAAVVSSALASSALERGDVGAAIEELRVGAEAAAEGGSMLLAASLRATAAELLRDRLGDAPSAIAEVDLALRAIPRQVADDVRFYAPPELWGDLHMTRALARQELARTQPHLLLSVTQDLTEALKVFSEDDFPEQFATCNSHLALAYLVMPMSGQGDRLRVGVAVTSLRAALRVYRPDPHPALWASTQMNLANALQYLPSVHQEENLDEAVNLYEELLQYRTEEADPLGYARILTNQANALGHLGVFSDARERLERAQSIFTAYGDDDALATIAEITDSLNQAQGVS